MRIRTTIISALALGALLLPALPTNADTGLFPDGVGDTGSRSDIRWVRVKHIGSERLFEVKTGLTEVVIGVGLVVYVDRNLGNPGPELRMVAYPDSEWALYRVDRWRQRGTLIDGCGRVSYSQSTARPVAVWHATRTCLSLRQEVRVAVKVVDSGNGVDWVPARRTFTAPVSSTG